MIEVKLLMFLALILPILFALSLVWFMASGKKEEESALQMQTYRNDDNPFPKQD